MAPPLSPTDINGSGVFSPPSFLLRMRSLKHLKHHTRSNVSEEQEKPLVRYYPKLMEQSVDAGTQTDPVVVLSLAQAAVLGLISQNEIFGATIAPNGFYTGEGREPPPPSETTEYEYADQLIGANGDYLAEPLDEEQDGQRRRPGPRGKTRKPKIIIEAGVPTERPLTTHAHINIKGEEAEYPASASCDPSSPGRLEQPMDLAPQRGPLKEERCCKDCPEYTRESAVGQQPQPDPRQEREPAEPSRGAQHELAQGKEACRREEEERDEEEGRAVVLKSPEEEERRVLRRYYESSVVSYETSEMGLQGDFEEGGQSMMWAEHPEGEGSLGRRMQIDRLDINVQIDESYCVDVGEGLKRWKCRMCEKSYTSKYNLVTHILGHNGIKPHECLHCGKLFKQPSHLQTHLLTHQGTRPHKCTVCKKAFTQTSHLKRHMLQHTDVKPYSCRFCGRGFAYPSELRSHEAKHENGHCHVCTQCGLEFPTHAHLKRHQASHQGPSTYQCTECHKSFAYRSQLQNHLMKHQNVRPFVCPECGMEFVQIHHLKQHALTHKGMKEFKCDVCSREFTLSANLKRHMLIHTSVRPFQCHVCFKTFVQKQTLKTHMIVHLPVKPFKCKVCGKSFNRMYNLLGHMHLHAGSKPFKCPYCSSKFNLKGNLSRHMKVKHGILDVSPDGQDALPDMEGQEEYEEESFEFSERENLASNNAQEMGKLAELAYYSYSKAATRYSTP